MPKKNKWFDEVFLPSLFEYAQKTVGLCKNCKISPKQYAICMDNMEAVNCCNDYSMSYTYYRYTWNDRQVTVIRHKSAYINFSLSTAEAEKMWTEEEQAREAERLAMFNRIKQNPERLEKSIKRKLNNLEELKNKLSEAIDDGESDIVIDTLKNDISKIQEDIDYLMH